MQWYNGGISEAIAASKAKGAIFVVYVEGKNEESIKITNLIENGELGRKLNTTSFVSIKIEAGSVPHQQFSEIFKDPKIPSLYFIGKNGTPLDILTGSDDVQTLPDRVDDVLQKAGNAETSTAAKVSATMLDNERSNDDGNNVAGSNVVCENDVCYKKPTGADDPTSSTDAESDNMLTHEEKVERAKELMQKKKEEKERVEKEAERLKEIERREQGKKVQQLKQWQEDQDLKQLKEEREKEKRENREARERVLAQIAQDKAERQSKVSKMTQPEVKTPVTISRQGSDKTRLQFKLPDGSSNTQEFNNSDNLQTVVMHIKSNINLNFANFRLSTTFPRREFTVDDYSQSLQELELTPNAVILILPIISGTVSTNRGGGMMGMFWSLLVPFLSLFSYIKGFVFGVPENAVGVKKPDSEPSSSSTQPPKRKVGGDTTTIRRQGNVHKLADKTDSDDEGNTWNGNSTQQM